MLQLDWRVAVCAIVNFIVLAGALTKFLHKPVLKMLDQRRQTIDEALAGAAEARRLTASTEDKLKAETDQARAEARAILAQAQTRGEEERQRLLALAREEAEALAREEAERTAKERERAAAQLWDEAAGLAIAAAERVLSQDMTEEQRQALLDRYIREAGEPA